MAAESGDMTEQDEDHSAIEVFSMCGMTEEYEAQRAAVIDSQDVD